MIALFIRYFFISLCSTYFFFKLIPTHSKNSFYCPIYITYLLSTSISIMFMNKSNASIRILFIFLCFLFYSSFASKSKLSFSYVTSIIAFCLSYIMLLFSCIIHSIPLLLIYDSASLVPYDIFDLSIGILQLLLSFGLLRSDRLLNGISLLIKTHLSIIGYIFSTLIIICVIAISNSKGTEITNKAYLLFITYIAILLLLYYWQHRITQTYLERLRIVNEKSLEDEFTSLKEEITSLKADNHRLTQIVHKDNKLVPAMETTVLEFLQSAKALSTEELFTRGNELSKTLQEMAKERKGILTSLSSTNNSTPSSGLIAIDGLLSYMEKRAAESNINYKVKMDDNIKELILTALNEDNLRHLLSDLIENAIIATNYSELPKHISIHLGSLQDKFLLEISDSGIPFNPETYQHFGYEHCSTHQEDGGTGTGLLDIWSIKKKYKASLYIYEYELTSNNIYTKKISFLFDGKNHFLLKTYRDKEIKNSLIRGDLHVFPNEVE